MTRLCMRIHVHMTRANKETKGSTEYIGVDAVKKVIDLHIIILWREILERGICNFIV